MPMIRTAFLLGGVAALAACNVHHKNPADGDENVMINADENGQVTFNVPFASGQVKLPQGMMENGDFDIDGVKMIPGGKITGFNVDAGDKRSLVNLAFKAPGSPDQVRAYFVDQFKQKGVDAAVAGDSISGKTKDGSDFVIAVQPAEQGSTGTIKIQDND
jgi:hypothetical protein